MQEVLAQSNSGIKAATACSWCVVDVLSHLTSANCNTFKAKSWTASCKSNLAPLNLIESKILQLHSLQLACEKAAKDTTYLYHLDLLHVACSSLSCVNQNCEGAACKGKDRLQIRGQPAEAQTLPGIISHETNPCHWAVCTCSPGGLLSSTASHTLIFRMKARSNCSTWDSKDSELLRQQMLVAQSKVPGPGASSRTSLRTRGLDAVRKRGNGIFT